MNTTNLKMCFWNIGGLKSKTYNKTLDPLFINKISEHDIILLAETHVGYSDLICVPGYNYFPICRNISNNRRYFGGLAILYKKSLKQGIKILPIKDTNFHWFVLKRDFFKLPKDIYCCVIYDPPTQSPISIMIEKNGQKSVLENLQDDVSKFRDLGEILLCGDFNARVGIENDFILGDENHHNPASSSYEIDNCSSRENFDRHVDSRGKNLLELCVSHNLRILNGRLNGDTFGKFTCHTSNGSSTVDYTIISETLLSRILYFKVDDFIPSLSDAHSQLQWCIMSTYNKGSLKINQEQEKYPRQFIWDDSSSDKFKSTLSQPDFYKEISDFQEFKFNDSQENIDAACDKLECIILNAAKSCLRLPKNRKKKVRQKKWYDSDLSSMRSQLINKGRLISSDPFNLDLRNNFFKNYRLYNKARKYKMKSYKKSIINKLENLHNNNPKQYWQLVNSLKESENFTPPVESEVFYEHFKKLNFPSTQYENRQNVLRTVLKNLEKDSLCFNEMDYRITEKEIETAIKKLKCNKSGGLQLITNDMLKAGSKFLIPAICLLFNKIFVYGKYPINWTKGYISPIPKSGDLTKPVNYRGLAVTGAFSKLLNSVLNMRLDSFLEKNNIISPFQIGFSKNARTADHVFVLKALVDKYFSQKKKVYACFIDFHKAFDCVLHTAIYIKLLKANIGGLFLNLLKDMYSKSTLCVKLGNELTKFFCSSVGVRQGDVLSPNLFKVFINDLPDYLADSPSPLFLNGMRIDCLMYADDVILLSDSASGLQNKINCLQNFCNDWCLSINISKTNVLIFNKTGRYLNEPFSLNGVQLECVKATKYLGVLFTCSGSFTGAQQDLFNKANKALWKLKSDFISLQPSIKTSCHVFDHTIKPILLYCSDVWGCYINLKHQSDILCNFTKLSSVFPADKLNLHFSKYILGVHKKSSNLAVMSELGRIPLVIDILKSTIKYWYRIEKSNNILLKNAYTEVKTLHNFGTHTWYSYILHAMKILDINISKTNLLAYKPSTLSIKLKIYCKKYYKKVWLETRNKLIKENGKLRTYLKFKFTFEEEKYLNLNDFHNRKVLTKFRISNHKLKIESGRFTNTPLEERICEKCFSDNIEDETHFLFECSFYNYKRQCLLNNIYTQCPNFKYLSNQDKLVWLMTMENNTIIEKTCEFLSSCLPV